ncbi:MAG: preprotein translocase subunit YajC [Corynebacterium sp.]|nr:preprotein translocase subunit YajC [Corynebacterium sp.]
MDYSIILFILVLAVVMIPSLIIQRKQNRRMNEIRQLQDNLVIGDKVITTAGLHATVHSISESTVELETSPGVISTWEKFAVVQKVTPEAAAAAEPADGAEELVDAEKPASVEKPKPAAVKPADEAVDEAGAS